MFQLLQSVHFLGTGITCQYDWNYFSSKSTVWRLPHHWRIKTRICFGPEALLLVPYSNVSWTASIQSRRSIRYWNDGRGCSNIAKLKLQRLTRKQKITELQCTDDNAVICHSNEQFHQSVNNFTNAYTWFGLNVNNKKTKILAQSVLSEETPDHNITILGMPLEKVNHFSYLGSVLF